MKWILGLIAFMSFNTFAEPVTIKIQQVLTAQGKFAISLFAKAESWDKETPDMVLMIDPAVAGESSLLVDLPPGKYGFFLYQDLDNNGKLKQTFLGFPAEPYAFSNNVKIKATKPSFASMAFDVAPGVPTEHIVQLNRP
jgi:uncharacterized protein (DUF2141 family)